MVTPYRHQSVQAGNAETSIDPWEGIDNEKLQQVQTCGKLTTVGGGGWHKTSGSS